MRTHLLIRLFLICVFSFPVWANNPVTGKYSINRAETPDVTNSFVLPYFFTGETTGFNVGIGGAVKGYGQDQLLLGATAWGGKDSYGVAAALVDYLTPWSDRLFFSSNILFSHAPNRRAYAGEQSIPTPIDQPFPGSSGSSPDQYLQGGSQSNWLEFKLEYVLPIGDRKHRSIKDYRLRGGLLVDGPSSVNWNPLRDGATTLILHQYNRYQSFDTEQGYYDGDVNAFAIGGQYDNTDFAPNPSMGSRQYLGYNYEGNWFQSGMKFDYIEGDFSKYFGLGSSDYASQRIIALNLWTAYSPSWEVLRTDTEKLVVNGPPYNDGATLGGWNRLRGYDANRFHDKASLYGAAEYRYTLRYNPIQSVTWLKFLNLDWFQLVGFFEAGQVADSYDLGALTTDMKMSGGGSLRALVGGLVVRMDYAVSEEGSYLWFMYNHPF